MGFPCSLWGILLAQLQGCVCPKHPVSLEVFCTSLNFYYIDTKITQLSTRFVYFPSHIWMRSTCTVCNQNVMWSQYYHICLWWTLMKELRRNTVCSKQVQVVWKYQTVIKLKHPIWYNRGSVLKRGPPVIFSNPITREATKKLRIILCDAPTTMLHWGNGVVAVRFLQNTHEGNKELALSLIHT